jgi:hypothetical protein
MRTGLATAIAITPALFDVAATSFGESRRRDRGSRGDSDKAWDELQ